MRAYAAASVGVKAPATLSTEAKVRAKAAILGGLVADAATMPLHWIYDVSWGALVRALHAAGPLRGATEPNTRQHHEIVPRPSDQPLALARGPRLAPASSNRRCPRSANCFRALAAAHLPRSSSPRRPAPSIR